MIKYFARHPTAANIIMLILLILGWVQMPNIRRETLPRYSSSIVQVHVAYPGASATEVEEAICMRIEDALDNLNNVKEVISDAREGIASIEIEMTEGADLQRFMDDIKLELDSITDLPELAEEAIVIEKNRNDLVLSLLVSGDMDVQSLKAHCEDLKERMRAEGLSLIDILGFPDHQLRVELSANALLRHGLSAQNVSDIIKSQNIDLPAGVIETRERDILIRFKEERTDPLTLSSLVVDARPDGSITRIGDIAQVIDQFEKPEDKIEINGQRAGMLQIQKTQQQDSIRISDKVLKFLEEERQRSPHVQLIVSKNRSTILTDRLNMLVKNGWQGLILVFFTLWFFFNLKVSFWVTMGLPVAFLGGFYFIPVSGLTVNMITMIGLLLALGLIMDDAIVIAENIAAHREKGASPFEAAVEGTREVLPGVFSSFFTTIFVLTPLMFLTGEVGKILRVMPMILLMILAISLIEAFLILPQHLSHSIGKNKNNQSGLSEKLRHFFDNGLDYTRDHIYGRLIDFLLPRRYLVLGVTFGVFIISLAMLSSGRLKVISFAELEGNAIVARIMFPQGTPLTKTEKAVARINAALDEVNNIYKPQQPGNLDLIEKSFVQYNVNIDAFESGPHLATITVDLLNAEYRNGTIKDFLESWRQQTGNIPDAISLNFTEPDILPGGRPIDIRLQGKELFEVKQASQAMKQWFRQFPGISNLTDDLRPGKPELVLKVKEGSHNLGLSAKDIAQQVRTSFQGSKVKELQIDKEAYEIDVRLDESSQDSLADLEYFHLTLNDGTQIPLSSVVTIHNERGWGRISRVDGRRTVSLRGDTDKRLVNTVELIQRFSKELLPQMEKDYPNVDVQISGETKESKGTASSLSTALIIGLLGIFALLSFQFRSYSEPFTVLLAIPLALIGVIWGHILMDKAISTASIFGFIALAGIVVNDSILLVVFLKEKRRELATKFKNNMTKIKESTVKAASMAGRLRFRAIVLTSSTTIAGLIPILFEKSMQAQFLIPLVISTVFGLLATTILVLLIIPCFYAILSDFNLIPKHEGIS